MLLAIDIGNTNIVLGGIEGEKTLFTERLSTASCTLLHLHILYHIHTA